MTQHAALKAIVEALWDAADEDIATGGPDLIRKIFPTLTVITKDGISDIPDATVAELFQELVTRLEQGQIYFLSLDAIEVQMSTPYSVFG